MTADLRTVVTGAANGIGYAIAERLAARGDRVIGLDIERGDGSTDIVGCDLADGASRVEAVAEATRRLGGIDVLVNAAGVFREGGLLDSGPGDWRSV